jgi:cytosine/adenosine deaminase-related metal-dependent hydrolase
MQKFSADIVYPITSAPIPRGVIVTDDKGFILQVDEADAHDPATVDYQPGALIPGLINTHCHLELSHMKGKVDTGTGLLPFLQQVVQFRDIPQEEIDAAIQEADAEMYENGIVAVGDISNKLDTAATKDASRISYYTFVEMFDFLQEGNARQTFDDYAQVLTGQSDRHENRKSAVPHAPYTVSRELFRLIRQTNPDDATISIHNQETAHEDQFFLTKEGGFLDFYERFGFKLDDFQASGQRSIHYALANMNPDNRVLFVHNTMTGVEDIRAAMDWGDRVYWATCPNANLYIENRLPHYQNWLDTDAKLTIGTDSLTSNWQLSVLEEMKTIARYQSYVPLETLLRWATLNGAEALGFHDRLGSLEAGKQPGLVRLTGLARNGQLQSGTQAERIV